MARGSGVLLPITALPSLGGIGDLGPAAYQFVDCLARAGQRYWQVLPLNPPNPRDGESPYFSSSAFASSPLFISPERLAEAGLIDAAALDTASPLAPRVHGTPTHVDYDAVREVRLRWLEQAYETFASRPPDSAFERFCEIEAHWLDDFVLFTVLKQTQGGASWSQWPVPLRDRHARALRDARSEHRGALRREMFYQYLVRTQWNALLEYAHARKVSIIGDLPIYVSYESADVWANPHLFELDDDKRPLAVSGVPPDYFSATGQLWNNPVYRWGPLAEEGYSLWVRRLKALLETFDIVRIDHFRGLVQYWRIPAGSATAVQGTWCDVPTQDLFATLERELPRLAFVAEDLGHITPDVRDAMTRYGFPGMKVLMFAFGSNADNPHLPHNYEHHCLVYTGTHDNNTLRGWLEKDATPRERRNLAAYLGEAPGLDAAHGIDLDDDETRWALIRLAMMSVADVCILPMQDLLGLGACARMNDPAAPLGNWRWRCSAQDLRQFPENRLLSLTELYGRCPPRPQQTDRPAGGESAKMPEPFGSAGGPHN